MTIYEMTNRSNMVEVKVRKHFSGRMLTPGRPISRILSGGRVSSCEDDSRLDGHPSRPGVAARLMQSTRDKERAAPWRPLARRRCLCLTLLPAGVAWPRPLLGAPVGSYPTFSP